MAWLRFGDLPEDLEDFTFRTIVNGTGGDNFVPPSTAGTHVAYFRNWSASAVTTKVSAEPDVSPLTYVTHPTGWKIPVELVEPGEKVEVSEPVRHNGNVCSSPNEHRVALTVKFRSAYPGSAQHEETRSLRVKCS